MAETPSTLHNIQHIRDLLYNLVQREQVQTEIQEDIIEVLKRIEALQNGLLTAIQHLENSIESLHSTYRKNNPPPPPPTVPPPTVPPPTVPPPYIRR